MIHPRPLARCYICGKEDVPRTMLCAECNARNLSLVMRLLAEQGGLCALCESPDSGRDADARSHHSA